MSDFTAKLRAFAELGRISNLPTTFTNVLVGTSIALSSQQFVLQNGDAALRLVFIWIAIACFYVAGMAMNDFIDAKIDQSERPNRPIPSGRVSRSAALMFIIALVIVGLGICAAFSMHTLLVGMFLVALIVLYNLIHALIAASVIILGMTRGMVYVVAAIAATDSINWQILGLFAGALTTYTAAFSLIARRETHAHIGPAQWIALLPPIIAAVPAIVIRPDGILWIIIPLILTSIWLLHGARFLFIVPPRVKDAVMAFISGICLVDALYLCLMERLPLALIAVACCVLTVMLQRRVSGT
jgi:4-hydroxybenzoate polyprenyltransferase